MDSNQSLSKLCSGTQSGAAQAPKSRAWAPWLLAIAFAFVLPTLFGLWDAAGQDKAPPRKWVQKSEFKVVPIVYSDYKVTPQWKNLLKINGNNEALARPAFHELILNTLARDGWELIDVTVEGKRDAVFYLKRSLAPK